jgi:hypothetical protein
MYKLNKNFKSEIDIFLETFNTKLSSSQKQEIKKYARIHKLRDTPITENSSSKMWESF